MESRSDNEKILNGQCGWCSKGDRFLAEKGWDVVKRLFPKVQPFTTA